MGKVILGACVALVGCGGAVFTTEAPSVDEGGPGVVQVEPAPDAGSEASADHPDAAPDVRRLGIEVHEAGPDGEMADAPIDAAPDGPTDAASEANPFGVTCTLGKCPNVCPVGEPICCTGTQVFGYPEYTNGVCGCDLSKGAGTDCVAQ
jgi:hypothetical protein